MPSKEIDTLIENPEDAGEVEPQEYPANYVPGEAETLNSGNVPRKNRGGDFEGFVPGLEWWRKFFGWKL